MGRYLDDYDRDGAEDHSLENVDLYADESDFFDFESYEEKESYAVDEIASFDDCDESRADEESDDARTTRCADDIQPEEELADDPIRVYLAQMGSIDMLSC